MSALTIANLGLGLNTHDPATEIADGQMARALNVLFERGVLKTACGIAKIAADSLPLSSPVLGIYPYAEYGHSPTTHLVIATTRGLYRWNGANDTLSDVSPTAAPASSPDSIASFVAFAHGDAIAADGDGMDCYYHCLYSDGGLSPVFRWAGKFESQFAKLAGADGYHETDESPATPTEHYCAQVNSFYNSVILVNPKTWDATADQFVENPQAIYFGKAGRLETDPDNPGGKGAFDLTETGAGYMALTDTGGRNLWTALMGSDMLIVYQNNSIWYVYHVGGDEVFKPKCQIPDTGLLSPGLIVSWGSRHFLVGSDYKPCIYTGGTSLQPFGGSIFETLKDDVDPAMLRRCRMTVSANGCRIWLFVVRNGYQHVTRAYGIDTDTGAWMIRDFEHLYDETSGLTAATLAGASEYLRGRTWQEDIDVGQTYEQAIEAGVTWEQMTEHVLTVETMLAGDSEGNAFSFGEDLSTDDGTDIPSYADTKVFDLGRPDVDKWWSAVRITAKGTAMQVSWRIESFDTEDTGWTAFSPTPLTDGYESCEFDLGEVTSEAIQFRIANYAGSQVTAKKIVILDPVVTE